MVGGTVDYSWFEEGANVSGSHVEAIGGIVGANLDVLHALDISNCYMTGNVSSGAAICGFSLRGTVIDLDSAPVRVSDYSVQVSIPGTSVTAPFSIIAKTLSLSVSSSETGGTVYTVTPETLGEYTIEFPKDSGADSFRILFKDLETGEVVEETTVYSSGIIYLGQYLIMGQERFASKFCVLTRRGFAVILDVLP